MALKMSVYYEAARSLAFRLTQWSKELDRRERRFVVCTGGGPGIMEAANRGAAEAHGVNVGLTISIPSEEFDNPYVTRELAFHFPLLLHAQVLVRLPGESGDRVSRRLRHARRAVRAADAGADAQDAQAPADGAVRHRVLAAGDRLRRAGAPRHHRRARR